MSPSTPPPRRSDAIRFRPAGERFLSRLDWLESWHTFSFAGHLDRRWMGFGPLRVINDDTIAPGRGFDLHPHRDMEIVTVMVEGALTHRDSLGHTGLIRAGEVQRMSAGTGVVHGEWNEGEEPCRLLQIWIEPDRNGIAPAYEQQAPPIGPDWTPLLDPAGGDGAMAIQRSVRLWRARPGAGASLTLPLPLRQGQWGWLQLIAGELRLEPPAAGDPPVDRMMRGDGLGLAPADGPIGLTLTAGAEGADLLWFALD